MESPKGPSREMDFAFDNMYGCSRPKGPGPFLNFLGASMIL